MTEMVMRVAKAVFDVLPARYGDASEAAADWMDAFGIALVAMEAMREPTDAMLERGRLEADCCTDNWTAVAPCIAEHMWGGMMKAALNDAEREGSPAMGREGD